MKKTKVPDEIWIDPVVGSSDIEIIKAYRKKIMFDFIKYIRADLVNEIYQEIFIQMDF